jgi:signal transduction histidine kinase
MHRISKPMLLRFVQADKLVRGNPTLTEAIGFSDAELSASCLMDWIHPLDRPEFELAIVAGEGKVQARHQCANDDWLTLEWQVRRHQGEVSVLGQSVKSEYKPSLPADTELDVPRSLSKTLDTMARVVEANADGLRCSILLVDPGGEFVTVGAGPSLPAEYNAAVEGLRLGPHVGSCGTATFWNTPVFVEDIWSDPLWEQLRDAAAIAGVSSCWSMPITAVTDGEVLGAMALYNTVPSMPEQHHLNMLEVAARMVGLEIMRDRLEDQLWQGTKMEALGVLAGGVAHDFNNLLATVLGNAELATDELPPQNPTNSYLEGIITASLSAAELCNQMLAYAGRSTSLVEPTDCNHLILELGDLLKVTMSKKVALSFELNNVAGVMADRSQLRQVVMNLLTNASEAHGDAEGEIVISTSSKHYTAQELESEYPNIKLKPGEYVNVRVSDTGVGINSSTQAKIFDPFFSEKKTGRGLGLAAVQGIVIAHNGAINVKSTVGVGTKFSVLLPSIQLPTGESELDGKSVDQGLGARILVVDDEAAVRSVFVKILNHAGYRVVEASDGQEAIDIFEEQAGEIDCVLLDLSMPKLDGEQVFARMREIHSDVRVVLSSGFAEQEVMERFGENSLAGIIHKPARKNLLLAKIAEALV